MIRQVLRAAIEQHFSPCFCHIKSIYIINLGNDIPSAEACCSFYDPYLSVLHQFDLCMRRAILKAKAFICFAASFHYDVLCFFIQYTRHKVRGLRK
ncbi:hypothetical protein D3C81_1737030 [compost metagenome]